VRQGISLWGPVVAAMAAIFGASAQSSPPTLPDVSDKLLHAAAYAAFMLLALRATHGGIRPPRPRPALVALLLSLGYGALDEWHQSFVPGRVPSVADWAADAAGALLALGVAALLLHAGGRATRDVTRREMR